MAFLNSLRRIVLHRSSTRRLQRFLNKFKCAQTEISEFRLIRSVQFGGPRMMRLGERMMILSDQRNLGDCRKRNTAKDGKSTMVVSMHMNDLMGARNFGKNSQRSIGPFGRSKFMYIVKLDHKLAEALYGIF